MPTLAGVQDLQGPRTHIIKVATYEHPLASRGNVDERNMHVGNRIPVYQHALELHTVH
jgi:hypothetical protein